MEMLSVEVAAKVVYLAGAGIHGKLFDLEHQSGLWIFSRTYWSFYPKIKYKPPRTVTFARHDRKPCKSLFDAAE